MRRAADPYSGPDRDAGRHTAPRDRVAAAAGRFAEPIERVAATVDLAARDRCTEAPTMT